MPAPDAPGPYFVSPGGTLRDRFPTGRRPAWLGGTDLDVYAAEFSELTTADRARAAVLWSKGRGVVAGVTASAFHPTQGGFEDAAGVSIDDLLIASGILTLKPGTAVGGTEWQVFGHYYDDTRDVTARPDNTGRGASRADVQVATVGTSLVGAWASPAGRSIQ